MTTSFMNSTIRLGESLASSDCQCTSSSSGYSSTSGPQRQARAKRPPQASPLMCTRPLQQATSLSRLSSKYHLSCSFKFNSNVIKLASRSNQEACNGFFGIKCEQSVSGQGGVLENGAIHGRETLQDEVKATAATMKPEKTFMHTKTGLPSDAIVEEFTRQNLDIPLGQNGIPCPPKVVESATEKEAWELLKAAVVTYCGEPVGTIAAKDPSDPFPLNYDQVFIRDFIPSAMAFLLKGETEIVRNFILHTLQLQSWEKTVDCYSPGQGLMPASFKVQTVYLDGADGGATEEILDPDFGEAAIGRVAPVDSGLWWIILLRAYGKCTGNKSLQERVDVQTGIKMILKVCLSDGFDMFPSLLVTDGSCMIDRRMGIHGHPLEIQALFYQGLRFAREMLVTDGAVDMTRQINSRLSALCFHIQEYYWLDIAKLNEILRYKTEEYSHDAVNKFNIYPEQVSEWLVDWMPEQGGYFIGNLQPAHMDFRWFALGNIWSISSSLATKEQAEEILKLMEIKWDDLIGTMPMKICFPSLSEEEWRIITGADPKNTSWSYHNGGSWPTLLWQFTVACIKMDRPDLAQKAVEVAEKRLARDRWPEYYDTRTGRFIGKQARLYQTWSIAGYLTSKMLLNNPKAASWLTCGDDDEASSVSCGIDMNPRRRRKYKPSSDLSVV